MRRYLEVLSEGLADGRKYMLISTREGLVLRFDLKDTGSGVGIMETDVGN